MTSLSKKDFTIHGVQWMDTDDGYAYNFTLKLRGRKVAEVSQGGFGGPTDVRYSDKAAEAEVKAYCATIPPEVCDFNDHATGQPAIITYDDELLMDELFGDWDEARQLKNQLNGMKRAAKTQTLFKLKGEADDRYHLVKATGERAMSWLREKYKDQLASIFSPEAGKWVEA